MAAARSFASTVASLFARAIVSEVTEVTLNRRDSAGPGLHLYRPERPPAAPALHFCDPIWIGSGRDHPKPRWEDVGHGLRRPLDSDPPSAHLVGCCGRRARAREQVDNEFACVGSDVDDAPQQLLGLRRGEHIGVAGEQRLEVPLGVVIGARLRRRRPHGEWTVSRASRLSTILKQWLRSSFQSLVSRRSPVRTATRLPPKHGASCTSPQPRG